MPRPLTLSTLPGRYAVCRLDLTAEVPPWAIRGGAFASITRTTDELSIVCPEGNVPPEVVATRGFRALKLHGPFHLAEVGILASVVGPLASAGVAVFVVATFDTDYVLVADEQLAQAIEVLVVSGHAVVDPPTRLFAYGTLGPNDAESARAGGWEADAVRGRLYDVGPYPALVDLDHAAAGWVEGHVRALRDEDELVALDEYEGVAEGLYRRAVTVTRGGRRVWVYEYARPLPSTAVGPSSRWSRPRQA